MKKKLFIIIAAVVLLAVIAAVIVIIASANKTPEVDPSKTVVVSSYKKAELRFDDKNIKVEMSAEDTEALKSLFEGHLLTTDLPACGFWEGTSVTFDGEHEYWFGCDRCGSVYSVEQDKYFGLSESQANEMFELLGKYGLYFPCV